MFERRNVVIAKRDRSGLTTILERLDARWANIVGFSEKPPFSPAIVFSAVDVWLVDLKMLTLVARRFPADLEHLRSGSVLLCINKSQLLSCAPFADIIAGLAFMDDRSDLGDAIFLARERHSLLSRSLLAELADRSLRQAIALSLSHEEAAVLTELGRASTNRQIADALALPEAKIKSLVRSVLAKCAFRNRTEAAVFAAREHELNGHAANRH